MSEELKPCPFGTHHRQKLKMHHRGCRWYESGLYAIQCEICGIRGPYALGEERAIERWNARAERTCRIVESEPDDEAWVYRHEFSCECGQRNLFTTDSTPPKFCPNYGAKVIEEKGKGNDRKQ